MEDGVKVPSDDYCFVPVKMRLSFELTSVGEVQPASAGITRREVLRQV